LNIEILKYNIKEHLNNKQRTTIMAEFDLMMFSKHLQGYPLDKAAEKLKAMGIYSLDLTVRSGGHVEPENVEKELPAIHEKLLKLGISIGMMTTNIVNASDPSTEKILKTAASLGIKYYKIGYYNYKGFGSLLKQRKEIKKKVGEIAELNGEYGTHGGFHNHSDDFIGASVWDIQEIISDTARETMGLYLDPAHLVAEGGSKGWMMGIDLMSDRITMLAVKDARWVEGKHRYAGGRRHSLEFCDLENGNTPWPEVLGLLKKIDFKGPASIHSEYQGKHSYKDMSSEELLEQTAIDVKLFKKWLQEA
jgi:sugar phosphate isomerase/epimerase